MSKYLLKQIAVLSLILGGALGLITLIPYLGMISFLICIFGSGSLTLYYMQKIQILDKLDVKTYSIYGAISGFISFIGFSITFIPLATLIGILTKASYYFGIFIMAKMGFFLLLLIIMFLAITTSFMNGFGAMTTAYIIKFYNSQSE